MDQRQYLRPATIPSSKDFMTIFPSTPHAGNITLRDGGNNSTPMDWGKGDYDLRIEGTNTLRVTVPYYIADMPKPKIAQTTIKRRGKRCTITSTITKAPLIRINTKMEGRLLTTT